jgi:hypothetical protein
LRRNAASAPKAVLALRFSMHVNEDTPSFSGNGCRRLLWRKIARRMRICDPPDEDAPTTEWLC